MPTSSRPRLTKTERLARRRLIWNLWQSSEDYVPLSDLQMQVPDAWHSIAEDIDCHEPKVKLTLYLDRSVARSFKAMGKGYQARINRILDTWLQLQISGLVDARDRMRRSYEEIELGDHARRAAGEEALPTGPAVDDWPREEG